MRWRLRTTLVLIAGMVAVGTRILPAQDAAPSAGRPLAGALTGGAAGLLLGGVTGLYIGGGSCTEAGNPDACRALGGMLVGAAVGFTIGTPVGAHLFNRRRGVLAYSLLTSAALATAGAVVFRTADANAGGTQSDAKLAAIVITVPVLQALTSTLIEMRSTRR
jgi:hypothetical protein